MSNSTIEENLTNSLSPKLHFTVLKDISGADSLVEIIKIENAKFVLKTYKQKRPENQIKQGGRMNAIAKRNREYYYQTELKNLGLLSLEFVYLDLIEKDQLCMNYLENLQIFAELRNLEEFRKLGKFIRNLIEIKQNKTTKFVDQNGIETRNKDDYFNWLKNFVKNRTMESRFVQLGLKIIQEIQQKTEYLTLLHSDFHASNIGLVGGQILLFDSGECPYLFGHLYHDITRIVMYETGGIIFEKEEFCPNLSVFLQSMDEFVADPDFLKFCYIQSILIKNNSFIIRRKEITEYLFEKLS